MRPKFLTIEGKRIAWRDILRMRLQQRQQQPQQPTLFPLKDDARPASQRTAAGRYTEPLLFED